MSKYVDGFVIPMPKKNLKLYRPMAVLGRKVWMDHGALDYYECQGDDLKMPMMGLGFPKLCKLKANETVIFAFIVYKSKAHRNKVNAKVMKDPRMQYDPSMKMPFSMKRFAVGGFKVLISS